jgi:6-phosphogluconate dehydrogenase (decarboxylating)
LTKGKPKEQKSFQEVVKEFDEYVHDPDQFYKIFSELGFSYVDGGCSGGCNGCKEKATCEVYAEITSKDENLN